MGDWKASLTIHSLARDLGLRPDNNAVDAIKRYCEDRIHGFLRDFPSAKTLNELLEIAANKLQTRFEEIQSDSDLVVLVDKYVAVGEKAFAVLEQELSPDVFGITFKRTRRKSWEPAYVSVIDSRASKFARRYFTKWHELGHLLILTDQLRLEFRRTHLHLDERDPEERLVDVLAGEFGFLRDIVVPHADGSISFDKVERIRSILCPDASLVASLIGITRTWPEPCVLVRAEEGLRKKEQRATAQGCFGFVETPHFVLRAVNSSSNEAARDTGLLVFPNMRIPEDSIIAEVYRAEAGHDVRIENLDSWLTTDGTRLRPRSVRVEARWAHNGVDALITAA
jgi:hypothetical protein